MLVEFKVEKGVIIIDSQKVIERMHKFFAEMRKKNSKSQFPEEGDFEIWLSRAQDEIKLLKFYSREGVCYTRLGDVVEDGAYSCMEGYLR